ncbi:MAG: hypothetical protein HOP19_00030 [Acidobacteria bacterium]|nr:hypothetical protein [Acidobacteriota bacterium]
MKINAFTDGNNELQERQEEQKRQKGSGFAFFALLAFFAVNDFSLQTHRLDKSVQTSG